MQNIIKQIADEYEKIVKETGLIPTRGYFENTLKNFANDLIKSMLVEEKAERGATEEITWLEGFNQCCAIGRENAKKIEQEILNK